MRHTGNRLSCSAASAGKGRSATRRGHGWDLPYPQEFQEGAWVTRDCVMKWTKKGRNKEMTSGYSMDSAYGAFMALYQCAHNDGYTMGYNADAAKRSLEYLLVFLRKTWSLE